MKNLKCLFGKLVFSIVLLVGIVTINVNEPYGVSAQEISKSSNHLMAMFNNYNGAMSKVPNETTNNFTIESIDESSNIGLKVSTGRYVTKSEDDAYLDLGYYGPTDPSTVSIKYTEDIEFKQLYEDIKDVVTYDLVTAVITTSYVNNVQDIALFWKKLGSDWAASNIFLIYQLEGENQPWTVLGRDDGENGTPYKAYRLTNEFGTNDETWSHSAAFAGKYDGTSEPSASGPFAKELKGKNARLGFVMEARTGYGYTTQITAFMINRSNSIMNFVDLVENGLIDSNSSVGYDRLVKLGGLRFLQSHANAINIDYSKDGETKNYYQTFNSYYLDVTGNELPYAPIKEKPTFVFSYEQNGEIKTLSNGMHFMENEVPTFTIKTVEEDVKFTVIYLRDEGGEVYTELEKAPTEPGTYSVRITSIEDNRYLKDSAFVWYVIDPLLIEGQITVKLVKDEGEFVYDGKPHSPVWHFEDEEKNTIDDVKYTVHYSSDETLYNSEEAPTDIGYYSISITIVDDIHIISGNPWIVFHIFDNAEAFIRDWNALRVEGDIDGLCHFTKGDESNKLLALITRYDNLSNEEKEKVDSTFESDGMTYISNSIKYFRELLDLNGKSMDETSNKFSTPLVEKENSNFILLLVSVSCIFVVYLIFNQKKHA